MDYEYEDCTFTLNRPERRNAFSVKLGEGLRTAIASCKEFFNKGYY